MPGPHGSRLPGTTAGGRPGCHPLSKGMRHLSKEGRRRREVREPAQSPLLLQQEAAGVLLGIALGAKGAARVGHLMLPVLATLRVAPRQDPEGSLPEAALLGGVPAKPAVPLLGGVDVRRPHVHLLRPAVALGIARPVQAMLEPQLVLLKQIQRPSRSRFPGGGPWVTGRGGSLACGGGLARGPTPSVPSVGRRASRRVGRRAASRRAGQGAP